MNRRAFLQQSMAVAAAAATTSFAQTPVVSAKPRFQLSLKYGMIKEPALSVVDKFKLLKDLGYDGVEMDGQYAVPAAEIVKAVEATGLPVHGVVNSRHWSVRLSDPKADVREKAVQELSEAVEYSKAVGGSTVLLVPGKVADAEADNENKEQVWQRSIEGIRRVLPLAAERGIRICIENVWNKFLYQHGDDAPANQSADQLVKYLDEIDSAWIGSYFDIGNHVKYGDPAAWARSLGNRIVKLDVKDYRVAKDGKEGFVDIGEGSVNWPQVREALAEVNYYGWATAEVGGGNRERLTTILNQMKKTMLGVG